MTAPGTKSRTATIALNVTVTVFGILMLLPFIWMISASFKSTREILRFPPTLLPESFSPDSYQRLFTNWPFATWYLNSLLVAITVTLLVLLFCSMAGFAFAKHRFAGKKSLFFVLLGSTMIPFHIILIPLFILVSRLNLTNSLTALVVPFLAPAIGIFMMRQFISLIPTELIEAARVDGASEFRVYRTMILPLAAPGLATLAIITFLQTWNDFLWPLTVLRRTDVLTLPVGMSSMLTGVSAGTEPPYGAAMAAAVLVSFPIIAVFVYVQRYFISGLAVGGVKG